MKFGDAKPGDILEIQGLIGVSYFIKCQYKSGLNVVSADKDFILGYVPDTYEVEKVGNVMDLSKHMA